MSIRIKIGEDEWAVWSNGHGHGNRFLWAAARALWRRSWSEYGGAAKVKDLPIEDRRERAAFLNITVVLMGPAIRECYMSRVHGKHYDSEDHNWYVELHDAPGRGRWPVTVWEAR